MPERQSVDQSNPASRNSEVSIALNISALSTRCEILRFQVHICPEPGKSCVRPLANTRLAKRGRPVRSGMCCPGFEKCRTHRCSRGTFDQRRIKKERPSYQGLSH